MADGLTSTGTITALFTPGEIECLIKTAAETVHGAALSEDSLSSTQIRLAARAPTRPSRPKTNVPAKAGWC
jgi:hypothetical protein